MNNVFTLKGGMGKKQRRSTAEPIAAVPESAPRVILATGSYIGEGFGDARLDTLFLAMPISWKGTLQQYEGVSTDFMMPRGLCECTITWTPTSLCWRECTRVV